jgi:hypothetical protein
LDSAFIEQKIAMLEKEAEKAKCPRFADITSPQWAADVTSQGFKIIGKNTLYKDGIYFIPLEGDYYAFVDYPALKKSFGSKLPQDWAEYLDIMDLE